VKFKLSYHYVITYNIFYNNGLVNGIGSYKFTIDYLQIMTINSGKKYSLQYSEFPDFIYLRLQKNNSIFFKSPRAHPDGKSKKLHFQNLT